MLFYKVGLGLSYPILFSFTSLNGRRITFSASRRESIFPTFSYRIQIIREGGYK